MNKWIIAGIISIATAGIGAYAEEGKAAAPEKKCPATGECEARRAKMLEKFDANKDGKLDDAEKAAMKAECEKRKAGMEARKAKMLEKFDTNKDGKLDDAEKAAAKAAHEKMKGEKKEKPATPAAPAT